MLTGDSVQTPSESAPPPRGSSPSGRRLRSISLFLATLAVVELVGAAWLCSWMLERQAERRARVALEQEMGNCKVATAGPAWLRDSVGSQYFETVVELDLRGRHFDGETLEMVAAFEGLEKLVLWDIEISDNDLEKLRELTELQSLSLVYCDIKGPGLGHLGELDHLEELRIGPQIDDRAIRHLCRMPSLKRLTIYESAEVTSGGLRELRGAPHLEKLWLLNLRGVSSEEVESLERELEGVRIIDVRS